MMSGIFISLKGLTLMMNKINFADIPQSSEIHSFRARIYYDATDAGGMFITQNTLPLQNMLGRKRYGLLDFIKAV